MDLALNNLQWLICYKTKPNQKTNLVSQCFLLERNIKKITKIFFKYKASKKMLTSLWECLYDIISNSLHMFTIPGISHRL